MPVRRRGFPSAATLAAPPARLRLAGTRSPSLRSLAPLDRGSPPRARFAKPPTGTLSAFPQGQMQGQSSLSRLSVLSLGFDRAVITVTLRGSYSHYARERAERSSARPCPQGTERARARHKPRTLAAQMRRCSADLWRGGEGVLGGAPAERAHRLGATTRPNGGRSRTLPRRGHPHRPNTEMLAEARAT